MLLVHSLSRWSAIHPRFDHLTLTPVYNSLSLPDEPRTTQLLLQFPDAVCKELQLDTRPIVVELWDTGRLPNFSHPAGAALAVGGGTITHKVRTSGNELECYCRV